MDASEEGEVRAGTCFCNLFIFLGNVAWLKPENLSQPTGVGEGSGKREESILGKEPARNSVQCGILFVLVLKKQKAIPVIFFKKQQKKFFKLVYRSLWSLPLSWSEISYFPSRPPRFFTGIFHTFSIPTWPLPPRCQQVGLPPTWPSGEDLLNLPHPKNVSAFAPICASLATRARCPPPSSNPSLVLHIHPVPTLQGHGCVSEKASPNC